MWKKFKTRQILIKNYFIIINNNNIINLCNYVFISFIFAVERMIKFAN